MSKSSLRNAKSLRTQLIVWSVGILLLFMASQMWISHLFARSYAVQEKENQMNHLMAQLIHDYSDETMNIFQLVQKGQDVDNLAIMVLGEDELIYHSFSVHQAPPRGSAGIFVKRPGLRDQLDLSLDLLTSMEEDDVIGIEETFDYNGESRTITIWCSLSSIEETVDLFSEAHLYVSLGIIVLSVFGVVIFSRQFTEPISNMEQVASRVAKLDFSLKAEGNLSTRELASMADSINLMSENLERMIEQLSQDNRNLSSKVENQEKMDQMRRQFVANISHEMKTPLSMLMMYSESLKSDLPGLDKTFYYDTIIQEATGLNHMVEQLLDTSAVENGLAAIDFQVLDFSLFVTEFMEKTKPLTQDFQVTCQIEPDVFIKADPKYLEQGVRNYLSNAISHTEKGGEIQVKLEARQGQGVFSVYNQGKPIPEEDIPFLWDSFYRGDKSRTQQGGKRVGLGLYIVKTCISSHFGQVFQENRSDGVLFSFHIPLTEQGREA